MKKAWLPLIALAGILVPSLAYANASQLAAWGSLFPNCDGAGVVRLAANVLSRHEYPETDLD